MAERRPSKAQQSEQVAADQAEAQPKPSSRGAVQDKVLAEIRRGLMIGAFVPGQVLSLRKLAAQLGTSAMPVREALSHLVAANVLEALPSRSVRVPRLSEKRLREMTEVRVAIEGMATKMACQNASPKLIAELERVNRKLTKGIAARDIVTCLAANQEFHFGLYEAAESEILMPLIESLWLQCGPTMYFSLISPNMPWDATAHAEILDALKAGDPVRAQRAMTRDIRTTAKNLLTRPAAGASGPLASLLTDLNFDVSTPAQTGGSKGALS